MAIATAMPTAPEYLFNTLLATCASRIGTSARVIINPNGGYVQPCVFWTANVNHSGQAKTPPQQSILLPLEEMEATAKELHDIQMSNYDSDNDAKGKPPVRTRRLLNIVTSSTKIRIHDENQRGLLEYIDELVADFGRLNQYTNGKGEDLQLELSFWNGSGCNFDRHDANPKKSHQARLFLKRTALSKTGTYQWDTLARLMTDDVNFVGSGYSARFLYCSITDAPPRYLDLLSPTRPNQLKEKLQWLYGQLEKLPPADYLLSHEAKVLFQGWNHTLVNAEIEESHFGLSLVYAKIESYTARLALWLHIVNAVLRGEKPTAAISGETMRCAIEIASFYLWQHKLIHAHNSPTRQLEGIFLKAQNQAEKLFNRCGKGIGASFLKTRINRLKNWAVDKIRNSIFKPLAAAGHGRIEGEGAEMTYIPSTTRDVPPEPTFPDCTLSQNLEITTLKEYPEGVTCADAQESLAVGDLGGELVAPPIVENSVSYDLQAQVGAIGVSAHPEKSDRQPGQELKKENGQKLLHQFTNSSAETVDSSVVQAVGDATNSLPTAPTAPTAQELATLIMQCTTWVQVVEAVQQNKKKLVSAAKQLVKGQQEKLSLLLAFHLCSNWGEINGLVWLPQKLLEAALKQLTFTIQRIADGSILDAHLEEISGCTFEKVEQLGTKLERWIFSYNNCSVTVFDTSAIVAISPLTDTSGESSCGDFG